MTIQTIRRGCAVLTAALATAVLAACTTAGQPSPAARGAEPTAGSAGQPLVPGITGPPAIKVDPWAGMTGSTTRPHIALLPVPPASSGAVISLPLDSYYQAATQQGQTLSVAAAQVAQRCMSAAGFSFPVVPQDDDQTLIDQFVEHQYAGLTNLAQARAYGFQVPPGDFDIRKIGGPPLPTFASERRKHGAAWASALLGEVPGMRPGTPPLGCLRAANTLVFGNFNGNLELGLTAGLEYNAETWTESDPNVTAAQRAWSACMARQGLNYKSISDVEFRNWPDPPSPAEITTAVADVRCNKQANLSNTFLTVEAAYQLAVIDANRDAIQQVQADHATMQQRAQQVLALPAADILRFSKLQVHKAVPLLVPRVHGRPSRDR